MKFQLLSDLHLDRFSSSYLSEVLQTLRIHRSDYLFLAGDVSHVSHPSFFPFFQFCSQHWSHVFYVLGNHECYHHDFRSISDIEQFYHDHLKPFSNVHLLCNDHYVLEQEHILIYGSTLWTDPYLDIQTPHFYHSNHLQKPQIHQVALNQKDLLLSFLSDTRFQSYPKIILTHFPLSQWKTTHPRYSDSNPRIHYFAWNLIPFLPPPSITNIEIFLSGHTHYSTDHIQHGYRLISNAIGYDDEETHGQIGKFFFSMSL